MNLSSDGLIELQGGYDGPLCPNGIGFPIHPAHALHVRHQDAVYEATPRDDDGEPATPELAKVNNAISYGEVNNRMRLYRDVVTALDRGNLPVAVEALFFRCGICGLILPANRVPGALR